MVRAVFSLYPALMAAWAPFLSIRYWATKALCLALSAMVKHAYAAASVWGKWVSAGTALRRQCLSRKA